MKKLYTKLAGIKSKLAVAALALGLFSATDCVAASNPEILAHVLKEGSLQWHVKEFKTPLLVTYNGQKYYLENEKAEFVEMTATAPVSGAQELEILKIKTRKNGKRAKIKMQLGDSIVKTLARVCPEEPGCKPCKNWQIKFLSTRKLGNKLPDNFLFNS